MKKLSILFLLNILTILNISAQQKDNWITLNGQLKGFKNQLELEDMSEFEYLLPPIAGRVIVPDSNGNFSIKFKAAAPNYYRLGYNILYLTPGCNLTIFINEDMRNVKFIGKDAAACTYLINTPMPKAGSFLMGRTNLKKTPKATLDTLEHIAALRYKELAQLKQVTPEFKRLERARIKADLINSIQSAEYNGIFYKYNSQTGTMDHLKGADSTSYLENYRKVSLPKIKFYSKNFTDASLMKLVVYRDIADIVIKQGGNPEDIRKIKDWYKCDSLVDTIRKVGDKKQLALFKGTIAGIKTAAYKNAVWQSYSKLIAFGQGDITEDFTAVDKNGNDVKLSSLKGKVIYVDLWATWCGPCMDEMPFLEKLKERYKDNPNVAFVSLSIDSSLEPWKQSLAERKADGYQWLINRYKLNTYNIITIPRILLIGKDFRIMEMSGSLPSDAKTIELLDSALAK